MKITVISDTHGNIRAIEEVIRRHPDSELVLHLGDGIKDIKRAERNNIGFVAVKGNCDSYDVQEETSFTFEIAGKRIFMTHGHKYSAKSTKEILLSTAMRESADICLFGHTHIRHDETHSGIKMINPGSLGYDGNYAVLSIEDNITVTFEKI